MSLWHDAFRSLYRHKTLGLILPFDAYPAFQGARDLTRCSLDELTPKFRTHWIADALRELQQNYERIGFSTEAMFKQNVKMVIDAIPPKARVFIIGANERFRSPGKTDAVVIPTHAAVNRWCRDIAAESSRLRFIAATEFIRDESDVPFGTPNHFKRMVYFRIFEIIANEAGAGVVSRGAPIPAYTRR